MSGFVLRCVFVFELGFVLKFGLGCMIVLEFGSVLEFEFD